MGDGVPLELGRQKDVIFPLLARIV